MGKINLKGMNKAAVLAALYNASKPQGMGFLHYDPTPMTVDQAATLLAQTTSFDYLKGRVMKVSLSGDEFDPWGYDRDNGQGAAERAIAQLLLGGGANSPVIQETHRANTRESAQEVKGRIHEESRFTHGADGAVLHLGLADVADKLGPAVDRAVEDQA